MAETHSPNPSRCAKVGLGILIGWLWFSAIHCLMFQVPLLKAVNDGSGFSTTPLLKMTLDATSWVIENSILCLVGAVILAGLYWRVRAIRLPATILLIAIPIFVLTTFQLSTTKFLHKNYSAQQALAMKADRN